MFLVQLTVIKEKITNMNKIQNKYTGSEEILIISYGNLTIEKHKHSLQHKREE